MFLKEITLVRNDPIKHRWF